jgi:hypothetical protein
MSLERLFARLFVAAGGVFWTAAVFGADFGYRATSPLVSARNALLPLALTLGVLAIGWVAEYLAAGVLVTAAAMLIGWGVVAAWEPGVWVLMTVTLLAPMLVAAALYFLSARMSTICVE